MDINIMDDRCRCESCGYEFHTAWILGGTHFPIQCPKCGEAAALRIEDDNDDDSGDQEDEDEGYHDDDDR